MLPLASAFTAATYTTRRTCFALFHDELGGTLVYQNFQVVGVLLHQRDHVVEDVRLPEEMTTRCVLA